MASSGVESEVRAAQARATQRRGRRGGGVRLRRLYRQPVCLAGSARRRSAPYRVGARRTPPAPERRDVKRRVAPTRAPARAMVRGAHGRRARGSEDEPRRARAASVDQRVRSPRAHRTRSGHASSPGSARSAVVRAELHRPFRRTRRCRASTASSRSTGTARPISTAPTGRSSTASSLRSPSQRAFSSRKVSANHHAKITIFCAIAQPQHTLYQKISARQRPSRQREAFQNRLFSTSDATPISYHVQINAFMPAATPCHQSSGAPTFMAIDTRYLHAMPQQEPVFRFHRHLPDDHGDAATMPACRAFTIRHQNRYGY